MKCFSLTLAAWCVLVVFATAVWAAPPLATVRTVNGTAFLRKSGSKTSTSLARRTALFSKDVVGTGDNGKVTLLFNDGAQVRLGPKAAIEITSSADVGKGKRSLFRAVSGDVWARLRPGNAIQTRTVTLGVRGTEIHLNVAEGDGTTTLTVVEGEVDFWNNFGEVVVQKSQQSVARPGQAPTAPVTVQNANFIIEWTFDLERALLPRETFFVSLNKRIIGQALETRSQKAQQNPNDSILHRELGDALFDARRYSEALAEYDLALRFAPADAATLTHRGYALLELDRLREAKNSFRQAAQTAQTEPTGNVRPVALVAAEKLIAAEKNAYAPAFVGLSWAELTENDPQQAQKAAEEALQALNAPAVTTVAANKENTDENADVLVESRIALGASLLRQPAKFENALQQFEAASRVENSRYRYQAEAWLALAYLQQADYEAAIASGQKATRLEPQSALAHSHLSLAYFFANRPVQARQAAEQSARLDPDAVAAQVALGQAALAQGDVDAATRAAARAVALDPALPQAYYLLGVASAGQRDYGHAASALRESMRLAPDFLPAASALAQVYSSTARPREAVAVLNDLLPRHKQTDAVLGALGAVYYQQGRYTDAEAQLKQAIVKRPNSALYHAELSRTLLYANRLNGAIEAGQLAVRLAPDIGQYHAILGLAYDFSQLSSQAEREFRTALSLDPHNALALAQLAYKHEGADLRPAASSFTQAFIQDPTVARQLLRGGVSTELTPQLDSSGKNGFGFTNRLNAADGKLNTFSWLNRQESDTDQANSNNRIWDTAHFLTYVPGPRTNLYAALRHQRIDGGLSGSTLVPDFNDRASFGFGDAQIAARHRLSAGTHLWLGVRGLGSRQTTVDPGFDSFVDQVTGLPVPRQRTSAGAFVPEARLDYALNSRSSQPGLLSFGLSYADSHFDRRRELLTPVGNGQGIGLINEDDRTATAYAQLAQRFGSKLSLLAQLRGQSIKRDTNFSVNIPGQTPIVQNINRDRSALLPSLLATYQADKKTLVRLAHNKRLTEFTASTFAPNETLITTQRGALTFGTPDLLRLTQVDVERYLNKRSFVKLFAFRSDAKNVLIGGPDVLAFGNGLPSPIAPLLTLNQWKGSGAGTQLEQQLSRSLFLNAGFTLRRTRADAYGTAPYEPRQIGNIGLNYITPSGVKLGLQVRHNGKFFQDSPLVAVRPLFGSRNYVDIYLAKEPSVRGELFISVTNLFDSAGVQFNGFPAAGRRIQFGSTRRF